MHAALQDPFLLTQIFDYVESPDTEPDRKPWTIACALTCKTFLSPALDVIWRELPDIAPLMNVIPGIKRRAIVEQGVKLETVYTEKELLLPDLERALDYAWRVRSLNNRCPFIDGDNTITAADVDASLVPHLLNLLSGKPLIPALQALYVVLPTRDDRVVTSGHYIQLLKSPSLKDVTIYSINRHNIGPEPYAPVAWHFIHSLMSIPNANIQKLNFETLPIPLDVLATITNLRSLQSLDLRILITALTLDEIKHYLSYIKKLCELDGLSHLSFTFEGLTDTVQMPKGVLRLASFKALKRLWIHGSVDMTSIILSMFRFPTLHTLEIGPRKDLDPTVVSETSWQHCFSMLKSIGGRLQKFSLNGWPELSTELSWITFAPLFSFRDLTALVIRDPKIILLSNEMVSEVVTAWPKMSQLHLYSGVFCQVNHLALLQITNGLPELEGLTICLSFAELSLEGLTMDVKPNDKLKRLDIVSISTLPNLGPVQMYNIATFVDALFPEVEHITLHRLACAEHVKSMIKGLQDTRRRERMRMGAKNNVV